MRGTAKPFERRYAGNQRKAVFKARFELDLAYVEIERRARNGTLIPGEPFDIGWQVIGNLCRKEAERRRGRFDSKLADIPHRDAIEELRRAALGVAEDLMVDMRATSQKKPGDVDPKRLQELIKATSLAASLPTRTEQAPQPKLPSDKDAPGAGGADGVRTGAMMRAHREQVRARRHGPEPSPEPTANGGR
jgi:hypothetical protein